MCGLTCVCDTWVSVAIMGLSKIAMVLSELCQICICALIWNHYSFEYENRNIVHTLE
jgi:hypothetical protein